MVQSHQRSGIGWMPRVASKLGLTFDYVRRVERGIRHPEAVLTALREDEG
jgi:hypothetical protein